MNSTVNPTNELLTHVLSCNGANNNNISITIDRRVIASQPLAPGDVIGPSNGLPSEYVLDPMEVLACHPVGSAVMSVAVAAHPSTPDDVADGGNNENNACDDNRSGVPKNNDVVDNKLQEEMAFWMALAMMGREAEERQRRKQKQQSDELEATTGEKKKRRTNDCTDDNNNSREDEIQRKRQQVTDAYLLSLPKEGPDPCCWLPDERSRLLTGTPLLKQVENTLGKIRTEYDRVVTSLKNADKLKDEQSRQQIPPFSVNDKGIFPSLLWARSMHVSRSFPRSLIVEEGVWWVGRKDYVPPSSTSSDPSVNGKSILSVMLGGNKAPVITLRQEQKGEEEQRRSSPPQSHPSAESPLQPAITTATSQPYTNNKPPPGCNIGILLPLLDMMDHKPGHPVQWESEATTIASGSAENSTPPGSTTTPNTFRKKPRMIRFRCVQPIAAGETIYNNYGPKGNGELLATYGFATKNNVMDSVEGVVLGLRVPTTTTTTVVGGKDDSCGDDEAHADGGEELKVHKARMALIQQHSIPHRFENGGSVLFLGPFSIMRKLSSLESDDKCETSEENEEEERNGIDDSGGVIPDNLYTALSLIGMEDVEEGPVVSQDELEMLSDVLKKKLDGFGKAGALNEQHGFHHCAESVEAYKDGQRELLQMALGELDALMPEEE